MASIFVVVVVSSAIVLISLAANSFDTQNAAAASSVVISGALPSLSPTSCSFGCAQMVSLSRAVGS